MGTIEHRIALLDLLHNTERDIMARKASDYSGGGDCNRNIKACERLGIASAETGVLIRLMDKIQRVTTLITNEAKVKDETIFDTIIDARNYLCILYDLLQEKAEKKPVTL